MIQIFYKHVDDFDNYVNLFNDVFSMKENRTSNLFNAIANRNKIKN